MGETVSTTPETIERDGARPDAAFEPRITAFVCNWCTYTGADLAGTSRLHMASNVRIIRLPCTGRIDPMFILKAFEKGADGVMVSGCHPADCHYTSGNYHARRRFGVFRDLASFLGIDPGRLTFSWVSASEGAKWRDVVNETVTRIRELGPFDGYRELIGQVAGTGESYATIEGLFEPDGTPSEGVPAEVADPHGHGKPADAADTQAAHADAAATPAPESGDE
jgi:F420-non-reducing hydrogenase iron-sulfur subunit